MSCHTLASAFKFTGLCRPVVACPPGCDCNADFSCVVDQLGAIVCNAGYVSTGATCLSKLNTLSVLSCLCTCSCLRMERSPTRQRLAEAKLLQKNRVSVLDQSVVKHTHTITPMHPYTITAHTRVFSRIWYLGVPSSWQVSGLGVWRVILHENTNRNIQHLLWAIGGHQERKPQVLYEICFICALIYNTKIVNRYKWLLFTVCGDHCTSCTWDATTATTTCNNCEIGWYAANDGTCSRKCLVGYIWTARKVY